MHKLKTRLKNNEIVYGTMLSEIYVPNIIRVLKVCGFDFIIIDCEHGYFDYTSVSNLIAVAKGVDIPTIIRIPKIDRECILKYMEMGANGILIPMTSSAEDIKTVIDISKYLPLGNRGVSTLRAHTEYDSKNMIEYMKKSNEDTIIIAQIESSKGIENIEGILAVNGLDGVAIGPNDMSMEMGIFGQYENPLMEQAIEKVVCAAKDAGRWSGIISSNKKLLKKYVNKGMQFLSWNSEIGMIMESGKEGLKQLQEL